MSGCFGNTQHDRWLENQVWAYYRECDTNERRGEEEEKKELLKEESE